MQRSSSLVLGAEEGWEEEAAFIRALKLKLNKCDSFYHVITLEGIKAHFSRKDAIFPKFKDFSKDFIAIDGKVAVKKSKKAKQKEPFYLRKLPQDASDKYFKLDRQARVLAVIYEDDKTEVLIGQSLGSDQVTFRIRGEKINDFINKCINYYWKCELVAMPELELLYSDYVRLQNKKQHNV